jgi:hypothetical protein
MATKTAVGSFDDGKAWLGLLGAGLAVLTVGRKLMNGAKPSAKDWLGGAVGAIAIWGAFGA